MTDSTPPDDSSGPGRAAKIQSGSCALERAHTQTPVVIRTAQAPGIVVHPDWEARILPFKIGSGRTLSSQFQPDGQDLGENRMRMRVFYRKTDGHLVGRVWFGDGAEGPPDHVHGGASAYVLDEAMGCYGWMHHYPVLAAHLSFDYHRPTPLFHDLNIEAWADQPKDGRLIISSRLMLNGKLCVSGKGEFAIIPRSKIAALANPNDPQVQAIIQDSRVRWAAE